MKLRIIDGFVCVAALKENPHVRAIFGKPINPKFREQEHEAIESNGIVPYDSIDEARSAKAKIERRADIGSVWTGRLRMDIAESDPENNDPVFQHSNSLIIVMFREEKFFSDSFWGLPIKDRPDSINGTCALLTLNDLTPFPSFERVKYPLAEAIRLSWLHCSLATFSLERVAD